MFFHMAAGTQTSIVAKGGKMPPSLARWAACHYDVAAAILAASDCGFQPRVPRNAQTLFNCTLASPRGN